MVLGVMLSYNFYSAFMLNLSRCCGREEDIKVCAVWRLGFVGIPKIRLRLDVVATIYQTAPAVVDIQSRSVQNSTLQQVDNAQIIIIAVTVRCYDIGEPKYDNVKVESINTVASVDIGILPPIMSRGIATEIAVAVHLAIKDFSLYTVGK